MKANISQSRAPKPGLTATLKTWISLKNTMVHFQMMEELWQCEDGLTSVEYALMMMLVAVASAVAWATMGTETNHCATVSGNQMPN